MLLDTNANPCRIEQEKTIHNLHSCFPWIVHHGHSLGFWTLWLCCSNTRTGSPEASQYHPLNCQTRSYAVLQSLILKPQCTQCPGCHRVSGCSSYATPVQEISVAVQSEIGAPAISPYLSRMNFSNTCAMLCAY